MRSNAGFTLIELVIVLVILGTLAAVAVPQLSGTSDTADASSVDAQVGALRSANAINVANARLGSGNVADTTGQDCDTAVTNLADQGLLDKVPGGSFTVNTVSSTEDPMGCSITNGDSTENFTLDVVS